MSHDNWVLGIEDEIKNAPFYKFLWAIVFLLSGFILIVLDKIPDIPWGISDFENENRYLKKNKQYIKNCNR